MKISPEQVHHVALLARLALDADAERTMAETLDAILSYVAKLDELDTGGVEPTAHVIDVGMPWREDEVTNVADADALLANAPARDGDFFRVPKIIE